MSFDAFYELDGELVIPTEATRGPWDHASQHAGPPAALLGREIEALPARDGVAMQVGRVTYEVLRPVPIAPLTTSSRVLRDGRRVQLVEARLQHAGEEVMRASAWRLRTGSIDLPEPEARETPPPPSEGESAPFFPTGADAGYHTAVEYRFLRGEFVALGPAQVWMRSRIPLVDGEELSPLQRVLLVADSGNGVSATLDWMRYLFINVDLSVHLHRYPSGEWVCLDAVTLPEPEGVGIADTRLYDERGPIGRAAQTLLVDRR